MWKTYMFESGDIEETPKTCWQSFKDNVWDNWKTLTSSEYRAVKSFNKQKEINDSFTVL